MIPCGEKKILYGKPNYPWTKEQSGKIVFGKHQSPAISENRLAIHHGLFEIQNDFSVRELLCKCTKIPSRESKT